MLPWVLLLVVPTAYCSLNCPYIFDGKPYTRHSILTVEGNPTFLQIEPTTNYLIFSLVNSMSIFTGIYILRNETLEKIDINDANVAATDFNHNRVFVGTRNGLKLLNNKNQASLAIVSFQNKSIIRLFKPVAEDKLFLITNPDNTVHQLDLNTFERSKVESIPTAWHVVADREGNIFYISDSVQYRVLLKDFKDSFQFVSLNYSNYRFITMDDNNRAIAAVDDGLYWLRPDSVIPKKLMNLDIVPLGVIFDCDDIYISTFNTIYKYSNNDCQESDTP